MDALLALSSPAWAGLSAVGGAVVGGLIAGTATYVIEGRRQEFERSEHDKDRTREDEARRAAVRGIARVLQSQLVAEQTIWQVALQGNMWPPRVFRRATPLSEADQQLLAANLSVEEWVAVTGAESDLSGLRAIHDQAISVAVAAGRSDVAPLPLSGADEPVRHLIEQLKGAVRALARLAHPPSEVPGPG